jgi:hypothetical protein
MADKSNSTPSPAPATDPLVALVARWHRINAALAATGDPAEQDRLAAELRNVECMMMATPATTAPGAVAGWELARHIRAQPACDRNHRAALYIALLENAADVLSEIYVHARQGLSRDLHNAAVFFENIDDDGRMGAARAVAGAHDFLVALSLPSEGLRPLQKLALALLDVDSGTPNPMLVPLRRRGSSKDQIQDSLAKAVAAAAVTILMEGGFTRERAETYVNRRIRNWVFSRRQNFDRKTLRQWRKRISGGLRSSDIDTATYYHALDIARNLSGSPTSIADRLLQHGSGFRGTRKRI